MKSLLLSCVLALPSSGQSPSALVVVLDDVGALDLGVAENIRAFADQGTSYSRAYSFPVCSPSRLAAMCGILPRRVGLGDIVNTHQPSGSPSPYPPCSLLSIAEAVNPAGYSTGLFGKYHLGRCGDLTGALFDLESSAFVQGWEKVTAMNPDAPAFGSGSGYYSWVQVRDGSTNVATAYATDRQVDEFLAWWQATPGPRLGWLALSAAHAPYDTPPGYPAQNSTREAYEAVLDYADQRLAEVFALVDLQDTYVLLVGDNGTPDAARPVGSASGIWKGTTREGGIRVPFILAGPGVPAGHSPQMVSLLDVPATLCELLGLDVAWPDSSSILSSKRAWVFSERYSSSLDDQAVIEANWKLRVFDPDGPGPLQAAEEFYWVDSTTEYPLTPGPMVRDRLRAEMASLPPRL